jgi:hypothetical protein
LRLPIRFGQPTFGRVVSFCSSAHTCQGDHLAGSSRDEALNGQDESRPADAQGRVSQTKWFHAYHEGDTETACGRPVDGLTPTDEEFLRKPAHCPGCDALVE